MADATKDDAATLAIDLLRGQADRARARRTSDPDSTASIVADLQANTFELAIDIIRDCQRLAAHRDGTPPPQPKEEKR